MKTMHVTPIDIYKIHIRFDDGVEWDIDLTSTYPGSVFAQLKNNDLWKYPKISHNGEVIYRTDDIDLDAVACHIKITGINPFLTKQPKQHLSTLTKTKKNMVQVSRFFGIIISMYRSDHNPPHFHVSYNEFEAFIGIDDLRILKGKLPMKILALVIKRAGLHKNELLINRWRAVNKLNPEKIEPLA